MSDAEFQLRVLFRTATPVLRQILAETRAHVGEHVAGRVEPVDFGQMMPHRRAGFGNVVGQPRVRLVLGVDVVGDRRKMMRHRRRDDGPECDVRAARLRGGDGRFGGVLTRSVGLGRGEHLTEEGGIVLVTAAAEGSGDTKKRGDREFAEFDCRGELRDIQIIVHSYVNILNSSLSFCLLGVFFT